MEAVAARSWWNENRDELKALATWDEFARKVRDRFVPVNWRMDALAQFYGISQGLSSFLDYATRLQEARNTLSSGRQGFTISDSMLKNQLLFFSHPILSLRMRAIPGLDYPKLRVDNLIALMSSTWDSMVAEHVIRPPLIRPPVSTTSFPPPSTTPFINSKSVKPFIPLTERERDTLRQAGGCFRCRRTPSSPGWVQHGARNCPGDEASGITPTPVRHVTAVLGENESDSEGDFVTAVFPSCVLGNGSFSEGEEDDE
jgi:hypothetical protein